jgi:hypothetical protein
VSEVYAGFVVGMAVMRSACLLTAWITFLSVSFFLLPDGIFLLLVWAAWVRGRHLNGFFGSAILQYPTVWISFSIGYRAARFHGVQGQSLALLHPIFLIGPSVGDFLSRIGEALDASSAIHHHVQYSLGHSQIPPKVPSLSFP